MDIFDLAAVAIIFGPGLFVPIAEMELEKGRLSNQAIAEQIEALRQELAALRDTTTQYDMSLQTNLEMLQERVRQLEQQLEEQARVRAF